MYVKNCMTTQIVAVSPETPVSAAARMMARHNIGALPVRAIDGSLCGIVTDRDLILRCVATERNPQETTVSRVMTHRVAVVHPEDSLRKAVDVMTREQVRRLPVVDGRRLVGMVSLGDLCCQEDYAMEAAEALTEITSNIKNL